LEAIKNGADKLRINPGNIGSESSIKKVAEAAKAAGIPIRVGVNSGSLEKGLLARYGGVTAEALCESALSSTNILEKQNFYDIVVSIKASDVPTTVAACLMFAEKSEYPQHIGITEAGTPYRGAIRSAAGVGALLYAGVGDTVRVSLTGDPIDEIKCAREILQAMKIRAFGAKVVSCPTCGRTEIDLAKLAEKVEQYADTLDKPLTIAVMGCVVNGPGEAREADYGIAGGKGAGVLFQKGAVVKTVPEDMLFGELTSLIESGYN
jgi:(E)-4-hydroxy-3-methylbut-2-enyl-diphosphate synthase